MRRHLRCQLERNHCARSDASGAARQGGVSRRRVEVDAFRQRAVDQHKGVDQIKGAFLTAKMHRDADRLPKAVTDQVPGAIDDLEEIHTERDVPASARG